MRLTALASVMLTLAAGCDNRAAGGCTANVDCDSGHVCTAGTCTQLCISDLDCDAGSICDDGLCGAGSRATPAITAVDGDGSLVCPDGSPGTHCMAAGLIVVGARLDGAAFTLDDGTAAAFELLVRPGRTNDRVELDLPDVAPGDYTLTAVNSAGSAQQQLTLLQGEPGLDGAAFSPTADELVTMINGSSSTIAAARLPVGEVDGSVAAGDHIHAQYQQAGDVAAAISTALAPVSAATVPAGAVVPFAAAACPAGWSEYAPAYGRFVRGIDRSQTAIDPDGERAFGATQDDLLRSHNHTYVRMVYNNSIDGVDSTTINSGEHHLEGGNATDYAGGAETRGKNVALLYCVKD